MNTVGELKEFLKDLSDEMPLVSVSRNYELQGCTVGGIYPRVRKCTIIQKTFRDEFDYEIYYEDVYVSDKNGQLCLEF